MSMAIAYLILLGLLFIFTLMQYRKWGIAVYTIMMLLNASLLFSNVLGVGSASINDLKMQCNFENAGR
jgi:type IV secretory pathway VirB2 component (pilin)